MQCTACVTIIIDFSERSLDLHPWLEGSQHMKYDLWLCVPHADMCVILLNVMSLAAPVTGSNNIFVWMEVFFFFANLSVFFYSGGSCPDDSREQSDYGEDESDLEPIHKHLHLAQCWAMFFCLPSSYGLCVLKKRLMDQWVTCSFCLLKPKMWWRRIMFEKRNRWQSGSEVTAEA